MYHKTSALIAKFCPKMQIHSDLCSQYFNASFGLLESAFANIDELAENDDEGEAVSDLRHHLVQGDHQVQGVHLVNVDHLIKAEKECD